MMTSICSSMKTLISILILTVLAICMPPKHDWDPRSAQTSRKEQLNVEGKVYSRQYGYQAQMTHLRTDVTTDRSDLEISPIDNNNKDIPHPLWGGPTGVCTS